uniref:Uncharacterized protein n=1 Tax=Rhizophora mucronata TaxID=61149 RepID=A0A2P2P4P6_RHIMU
MQVPCHLPLIQFIKNAHQIKQPMYIQGLSYSNHKKSNHVGS